jgi:hypothetical protein
MVMLKVVGRVYFYFWSHIHNTSFSTQVTKVPNKMDSNLL